LGTEIERKFRVVGDAWRTAAISASSLRQGFVSTEAGRTVRVRLAERDAWLTLKGHSEGAARAEFEYAIPADEAEEMLDGLCRKPLIEKTRYRVAHAGHTWEVDVFHGDNAGLVVAELELDHADEAVEFPPWVGREVTGDPDYYNANLVDHPFCLWPEAGAA